MFEEKDQHIDLIEKKVDDLRKEKDNLENISGRLEKEIYDKEEERKRRLTETKRSSNKKKDEPQHQYTKKPRSPPTKQKNWKRCYACVEEDHFIRECATK